MDLHCLTMLGHWSRHAHEHSVPTLDHRFNETAGTLTRRCSRNLIVRTILAPFARKKTKKPRHTASGFDKRGKIIMYESNSYIRLAGAGCRGAIGFAFAGTSPTFVSRYVCKAQNHGKICMQFTSVSIPSSENESGKNQDSRAQSRPKSGIKPSRAARHAPMVSSSNSTGSNRTAVRRSADSSRITSMEAQALAFKIQGLFKQLENDMYNRDEWMEDRAMSQPISASTNMKIWGNPSAIQARSDQRHWTNSGFLLHALEVISSPACNSYFATRCLKAVTKYAQKGPIPLESVKQMLQISDFQVRFEQMTLRNLATMDRLTLSIIIYSFSVLEYKPSRAYIQIWTQRAELVWFDAQGVSNCIYALAKLRLPPSTRFMTNWYKCFQENADFATPQGLTNSLWALAKLEIDPDPAFVRSWYMAYERMHTDFSGQGLANVIWALGKLEITPPAQFLKTWLEDFERHVFKIDAQGLSNILFGFAQIYTQSNSPFATELVTTAMVGNGFSLEASMSFLDLWHKGFEQRVQQFDAQGLANVAWSFGHLNIHPSAQFWELWLSSFAKRVGQFKMQHLSNSIWAMARLERKPPKDFVDQWLHRFAMVADDATTQQLSNSLWGFATLSIKPEPQFWNLWLSLFTKQVSQFKMQELSNSIWSMARLEYTPSEEFVNAWIHRFTMVVDDATTQQLSNSLWSFARLGINPDSTFLDRWHQAAERNLSARCSDTTQGLSNIIWAFGSLQIAPRQSFLLLWYDRVMQLVGSWECRSMRQFVWAFGRLRLRPRDDFMSELIVRFEQQLDMPHGGVLLMSQHVLDKIVKLR